MTHAAISGEQLGPQLDASFPSAVEKWDASAVWVKAASIADICAHLRDAPELEFDFLNAVTAVDYIDHFEVIYHLTSLKRNHSVVLKTIAVGRENPVVPSVVPVWRGADLQEREIWDLMGVSFVGHPNLKRLVTWEGFPGHPLRKDFIRERPV